VLGASFFIGGGLILIGALLGMWAMNNAQCTMINDQSMSVS